MKTANLWGLRWFVLVLLALALSLVRQALDGCMAPYQSQSCGKLTYDLAVLVGGVGRGSEGDGELAGFVLVHDDLSHHRKVGVRVDAEHDELAMFDPGGDASVVLNEVAQGEGNFGYNAATGEFGDMIEAGILDPTKVTRHALQNAASVSGLLFW